MFKQLENMGIPPEEARLPDDKPKFADKVRGLKELFYNSKNPIAVLKQELESDFVRQAVSAEVLADVQEKLGNISFDNADDFAARAAEIILPIWEITQKDKVARADEAKRELFSREDLIKTAETIKNTGVSKVYITGNVGSGKSTFARELSAETNFRNIDLYHFFSLFKQERGREAQLAELLNFVTSRESPPYIINHADLLRQGLASDADCLILLSPDIKEQLMTRQIRQANGAEGEWQQVDIADYEKINQDNRDSFNNAPGLVKYDNLRTGTAVKIIESQKKGIDNSRI